MLLGPICFSDVSLQSATSVLGYWMWDAHVLGCGSKNGFFFSKKRQLFVELPVASRLHSFGMLHAEACSLSGASEAHGHELKRCPYLSDCMSVVHWLWTPVTLGNEWYEPSCMCLEHAKASIESLQGWLIWSAMYVNCFLRCDSLTGPHPTTDPRRCFNGGTRARELPHSNQRGAACGDGQNYKGGTREVFPSPGCQRFVSSSCPVL